MAVLSGSTSDDGRDVVEPDRQPPDPKEKQVPASVVDLLDSPPPRSNPAVVLLAPGAPPPPVAAHTSPPLCAVQFILMRKRGTRLPSGLVFKTFKRDFRNSNLGEAAYVAASSSAARWSSKGACMCAVCKMQAHTVPYVSVEESTKDRVAFNPKPLSNGHKDRFEFSTSKSLTGTGNTNFLELHHTNWELPGNL
ncbi:hypothetical protein EJB05_48179 [Eragrostis curvula]|uniref:Uncharacterized protein n=1 Tax=Eragrostis curvula TaxID=38414 RepID=A0A5J9T2E6_9POAL|nr:hypothetical protein EJB05_48179 [Eragrostis curvula]